MEYGEMNSTSVPKKKKKRKDQNLICELHPVVQKSGVMVNYDRDAQDSKAAATKI